MSTRFVVIVKGCTPEQAKQVIAERLNHDENYGFDYTVEAYPAEDLSFDEGAEGEYAAEELGES